jgi:hypothetical protein
MLWTYTRGLDDIRVETSVDQGTNEYILVVRRSAKESSIERFPDASSFRVRLEALEQELANEQWRQVGPPVLLKDGWKLT